MLVLTRRVNEKILIGNDIEVTVVEVSGTGPRAEVRLGITAPKETRILREELVERVGDLAPGAAKR